MLTIKGTEFKIKFTEINIRQRMYQKKSYITLMITTEFFPSLVEKCVISGVVEVKLDITDIRSLDELVGRHYQGDIGNITISVNNDGIWEHQSQDSFEIHIKRRMGRELEFELKSDDCKLNTIGTMVSLYTTSTSKEKLKKNFELKDFYEEPMVREIGNSQIYKYYVKDV